MILKGGKEALHSNAAIVRVLRSALEAAGKNVVVVVAGPCRRDLMTDCPWSQPLPGLPVDAIQLVESREDVAQLLSMDTYIDVRAPPSKSTAALAFPFQRTLDVCMCMTWYVCVIWMAAGHPTGVEPAGADDKGVHQDSRDGPCRRAVFRIPGRRSRHRQGHSRSRGRQDDVPCRLQFYRDAACALVPSLNGTTWDREVGGGVGGAHLTMPHSC